MKLGYRRFDLRLRRTWRIASGMEGTTHYPVVFVELADESGRRGLGEAASTGRYQQPVEVIESFLEKVDPRRLSFDDVAGSMRYLDSVSAGHGSAKCGINIALLDGAARAANQSIGQMLGVTFTENRHVTSFSIGIDTPDVIREKAREAAGYPVLKLKVGSPDDRRNLAALREAAPGKPVRVDANEAWTSKEEALRQIEWLKADGHVQFIEQPMPDGTPVPDWVWLKQRSPMPIFGDESYHQAEDIAKAAECFHGVNVKLVKAGGMSGAYEALQAARRAGLQTMIGCMIESSVLITAAAHLADLTDHLDIDGNLLISNDPYRGATSEGGLVSFAQTPERLGLRVRPATE
ncbi:MAG TPA: dipeptide epimerase [Verrucomicrobiae bacterium]|nr:dipeptide epimerase [Verrucomicrobiae bacterium]